jgi:hypothetical protein
MTLRNVLLATLLCALFAFAVFFLRRDFGPPVASRTTGPESASQVAEHSAAGPNVGTRRRPPSFNSPGFKSSGTVEDSLSADPASPAYDALALTMVKGYTGRQIFDLEPRDPVWAKNTETLIDKQLTSDFARAIPVVKEIKSECKQSSCRIEIRLPEPVDPLVRKQALELAQLTKFGERGDVEPTGKELIVLNVVLSREVRYMPDYEHAWVARMRDKRLQLKRSTPGASFIPLERLPLQ